MVFPGGFFRLQQEARYCGVWLLAFEDVDNPIGIDYTCFIKKGSKNPEMSDNKVNTKEEQEIINS